MSKPEDVILKHLHAHAAGEMEAAAELLPLVYDTLKKIARNQVRGKRPNGTLSATALVNEAYLRLFDGKTLSVNDRQHFFNLATACMRAILVDYARAQTRKKRGGAVIRIPFIEENISIEGDLDAQALNEALESLTKYDPYLARVVELRFLIGLTIEETAQALNVSEIRVKRDWAIARAWLKREIRENNRIAG